MATRPFIIGEESVDIPDTMSQAEAIDLAASINPEFAGGQIRVGQGAGVSEAWQVDRVAGSKG